MLASVVQLEQGSFGKCCTVIIGGAVKSPLITLVTIAVVINKELSVSRDSSVVCLGFT